MLMLALHILAVICPGYTQPELTQNKIEPLHRYLQSQYILQRIPGMAVAVVEGGDIVYEHGFGTAGNDINADVDTPFFIGSLSKSITALAVMQLVDEGLVDLDLPIRTYLPWLGSDENKHLNIVTVRHFLNQTSGFTREAQRSYRIPRDATIKSAVQLLADQPATHLAGTTYSYFNPNYTVLGALIEEVSGMTYQEYVQEYIFNPLQMDQTFTSSVDALKGGLSQGFSSFFGFPVVREQVVLGYDLPAGFIISSADDMANFLIAQLNGGMFCSSEILSAESTFEMHQPAHYASSTYAMGWEEDWVDDVRVIAHSGSLQTFYSRAVMIPDDRIGFVVLINQNGLFNMAVYEKIADNIVRLLSQRSPKPIISIGVIYAAAAVLMVLDTLRHISGIKQLPKKLSLIPPSELQCKKKLTFIEFIAYLVVMAMMIGGFVILLGRNTGRVIVFNYIPEISIWLATSILLSAVNAGFKLRMINKIKLDEQAD